MNHPIFNLENHSNFNDEIINHFIDKSKSEYPFSIVNMGSQRVDITLFKNIHPIQYDFRYEDAIKDIGNFSVKLF